MMVSIMRVTIARWSGRLSTVLVIGMLFLPRRLEDLPAWILPLLLVSLLITLFGTSRLKCPYCKHALLIGYGSQEVRNFWWCILGASDFTCPSCHQRSASSLPK